MFKLPKLKKILHKEHSKSKEVVKKSTDLNEKKRKFSLLSLFKRRKITEPKKFKFFRKKTEEPSIGKEKKKFTFSELFKKDLCLFLIINLI